MMKPTDQIVEDAQQAIAIHDGVMRLKDRHAVLRDAAFDLMATLRQPLNEEQRKAYNALAAVLATT